MSSIGVIEKCIFCNADKEKIICDDDAITMDNKIEWYFCVECSSKYIVHSDPFTDEVKKVQANRD